MIYDRQNTILSFLIGIIVLFFLSWGGKYFFQIINKNKARGVIINEYRQKYRRTLDCELLVHIDSVVKTNFQGNCWLRIKKIDFIDYNKDMFPSEDSLLHYLDLVFYSACNNKYYYSHPYSVMAKKKTFEIYMNFKENKAIFIQNNKVFSRKHIIMHVNRNFFKRIGILPKCS